MIRKINQHIEEGDFLIAGDLPLSGCLGLLTLLLLRWKGGEKVQTLQTLLSEQPSSSERYTNFALRTMKLGHVWEQLKMDELKVEWK